MDNCTYTRSRGRVLAVRALAVVLAVAVVGVMLSWSGATTASASDKTPVPVSEKPGRPTGLTAISTANGVSLTWTAPSAGATPIGYRIARLRPTEGEKKLTVIVRNTGTADTSFVDTSAEHGMRYHYRVKALSDVGNGKLSNTARITYRNPNDANAPRSHADRPGVPTSFSGESVDAGIKLTWGAPTSGGVPASYSIVRMVEGEESFTFAASVTETGWTDTDVADRTKHHYAVLAKNESGFSSATGGVAVTWVAPSDAVAYTGITYSPSHNTYNRVVVGNVWAGGLRSDDDADTVDYLLNVTVEDRSGARLMNCERSGFGTGMEVMTVAEDGNIGTEFEIAHTCPRGHHNVVIDVRRPSGESVGSGQHRVWITDCLSNSDTDCDNEEESDQYTSEEYSGLLMVMVSNPPWKRFGKEVSVVVGMGGMKQDDDSSTTDYLVSMVLLNSDGESMTDCYDSGFGWDVTSLMTVPESGQHQQRGKIKSTCPGGNYELVVRLKEGDGTEVATRTWTFIIQ